MRRLRPTLISLAVLGAVVAPAFPPGGDSFPLSIYPMYARQRPDVVTVHTAIGVTPDGALRRLSMSAIADTDDPLVATTTVRDAVRAGPDAARRHCEAVLGRAPDVDGVVLVTERRDAIEVVRAGADVDPSALEVHARCGDAA